MLAVSIALDWLPTFSSRPRSHARVLFPPNSFPAQALPSTRSRPRFFRPRSPVCTSLSTLFPPTSFTSSRFFTPTFLPAHAQPSTLSRPRFSLLHFSRPRFFPPTLSRPHIFPSYVLSRPRFFLPTFPHVFPCYVFSHPLFVPPTFSPPTLTRPRPPIRARSFIFVDITAHAAWLTITASHSPRLDTVWK